VTNLGDSAPNHQEAEAVEAVRRRIEKKLKGILLERPENPPTVIMHTEGRKLMTPACQRRTSSIRRRPRSALK